MELYLFQQSPTQHGVKITCDVSYYISLYMLLLRLVIRRAIAHTTRKPSNWRMGRGMNVYKNILIYGETLTLELCINVWVFNSNTLNGKN